jgi:modulator of FtsH protease
MSTGIGLLVFLIGAVLGLNNGAGLIMTAFAGTGAIFLGMASLSLITKRDLGSMGKFLIIGVHPVRPEACTGRP